MGKPKHLYHHLVDTWRNRENLGLLLGRFYCMGIQARGATVKTAQELARHSTPTLTFNVYAHARLHDVASAVERLPDPFSSQHPKPLVATGTDPLTRPRDHLAAQGQRARDGNVRFVSNSDVMAESIDHVKMVRNPNEGRKLTPSVGSGRGEMEARPVGFEPTTFGFEVRDSIR